jgi:hypothetical protein
MSSETSGTAARRRVLERLRRLQILGERHTVIYCTGAGHPGVFLAAVAFDSSDVGALSAVEHEQAISDPIARERRFELAGALRDMGPALEMQTDHRPSSEDLGDVRGVIGGQGQVSAVEFR